MNSLPFRKILRSPFLDKHLVSYGIIAYCVPTKRWLLVNRKHSPDYIMLMRGSYRVADLPFILQGISKDEKENLQKIKTQDNFISNYRMVISDEAIMEDERYAWRRFQDNIPKIEFLLKTAECEQDTEWLFPKGRSSQGELPKKAAEREFSEETGINLYDLPQEQIKSTGYTFTENFYGTGNRQHYETKFWLYLFFEEIAIPEINSSHVGLEIGKAEWMSTEKACSVLKSSKKNIIFEVLKLISNPYQK